MGQLIVIRPRDAGGSSSGGSSSSVSRVFGRQGSVAALSGDYEASQITNDSTAPGGDVAAALSSLAAGTLTSAQRAKLDALAANAAATTTSVPGATVTPHGARVGTSPDAAKADHNHSLATGTPIALGVQNLPGSAESVALSDHQHAHGTITDANAHTVATSGAAGFMSAADKAKLDTVQAGAVAGAQLGTGAPVDVGDANAAGTSSSAAHQDHVHAHGQHSDPANHAPATSSNAGFMSAADKSKLDGLSSTGGGATLGSTTPSAVAASGAVGTATTAAHADHAHAHGAQTDPTMHAAVTTTANGFMLSSDKAKLDGIAAGATAGPNLTSTTPSSVGITNQVGTAATSAHADHVHAHGAQTDPSLHAAVTTSSAGFMSPGDKAKLDGIATGATAGPAISSALPGAVAVSGAAGTSTQASAADHTHAHGTQSDGTMHAVATPSVAGFLSAADKSKLDGLSGAPALSSATPSQVAAAGSAGTSTTTSRSDHVHAHGTQTDPTMHAVATPSAHGFLSSADKAKLDGIAAGASSTPLASTAPAAVAAAAAVGTASTAAHADHVHAHGAQTDPTMHAAVTASNNGFMLSADKAKLDGIAANASNTPLSSSAPAAVAAASAVGTGTTAARADHVHAHGVQTDESLHALVTTTSNGFMSSVDKSKLDGVAAGATAGPALAATAPATVGSIVSLTGTASTAAHADHVHAHGAQTDPTLHAVATQSANGFLSAADKTKLDGLSSGGAALGSTTPNAVAASGAVGSAATAAHADHVHAHGGQTDPTMHAAVTTTANGFMLSSDKSKLDSIAAGAPAITLAAPSTVGTSNAVGNATTAARADHVHAHGNQAGGTLHAAASYAYSSASPPGPTTYTPGFLSGEDKQKLDSVAANASANGNATPSPIALTEEVAWTGYGPGAAPIDHVHALATRDRKRLDTAQPARWGLKGRSFWGSGAPAGGLNEGNLVKGTYGTISTPGTSNADDLFAIISQGFSTAAAANSPAGLHSNELVYRRAPDAPTGYSLLGGGFFFHARVAFIAAAPERMFVGVSRLLGIGTSPLCSDSNNPTVANVGKIGFALEPGDSGISAVVAKAGSSSPSGVKSLLGNSAFTRANLVRKWFDFTISCPKNSYDIQWTASTFTGAAAETTISGSWASAAAPNTANVPVSFDNLALTVMINSGSVTTGQTFYVAHAYLEHE